jgi:hypothetical protein
MAGRTDIDKYKNACRQMVNIIPYPHGPATMRPGFRYIASTKYSDKKSILIPFVSSDTQAYVVEFGDYYARFYTDGAQISITPTTWAKGVYYGVGVIVTGGATVYRCIVGHTSDDAALDLLAGYWVVTDNYIYEIPTPYGEDDLEKIKYCQSIDVAYVFHPDYAIRKLLHMGETSWDIIEANFRPPPLVEAVTIPDTTVYPEATTGTSVKFIAGSAVFQTGDVNRIIQSERSRAIIKAFINTQEVTCEIIDDFLSTLPIASGSWKITGSPKAIVIPSISEPANASVTITVDDTDESGVAWVNLIVFSIPEGGFVPIPTIEINFVESSVPDEHYVKLTASCKPPTEPAQVKYFDMLLTKGTVGTLGNWGWAWGDNDGLGQNTLYVKIGGANPNVLTAENLMVYSMTNGEPSEVFRETDEGKYLAIYGGLVRITTFVDSQTIVGDIIQEMLSVSLDNSGDIEPTSAWTLYTELWNATNGYPSCGTFYEDRLFTAGVNSFPENIRASQVGDYENFTPGITDADSIDVSLSGRSLKSVRWIEPREYLIVGTDSSEWRLGPEDTGQAMTPLNIVAKQQTTFGCADIPPISIGNCTLFIQKALRKIREFTNNPTTINIEYVAPDLTLLAEHITERGIKGICYQQEPFSIVWAWLEDGNIIGMTYLRDQEVIAWHKHPTNGECESMCVIPGTDQDEVWAIIKRTINGNAVRYIERLEPVFNDTPMLHAENKGENAFFVDSGVTYNGDPATVISGGEHLEGEPVVVVADGAYVGVHIVTSGAVTLKTAASVVHYGLPYEATLEPMLPELSLRDGTAQARMKKTTSLRLRLLNTGAFKCGRDELHLEDVIVRATDDPMGTAKKLYNGDKVVSFEGAIDRDSRIVIVQDKPLPLTVVAIYPEVSLV